jgi:hypothetical protein
MMSNNQGTTVRVSAKKECRLTPWIGMSILGTLEDREHPVLEVSAVILIAFRLMAFAGTVSWLIFDADNVRKLWIRVYL